MYGQMDVALYKDGESISKNDWALNILNEMKEMNNNLSLGKENIINAMIEKVIDPKLTYAYRISEMVKEEGFLESHLKLAKEYKEDAYKKRFKLEGFEDLELSTQILMKEAIKRGIKVNVIDRADNFISLKKDNHIEYVKQATKTSKDSYISFLMMENKVVTKKILEDNSIKVPNGDEYFRKMILEYIKKYKRATKDDITALIMDLLPPVLSPMQKRSKVTNLLSSLRIKGVIEYSGGFWILKK